MQQSLLLTWVDLGLAVVLLVSVIVGAVRGLVFEALSLAAWVVAYFCAPLLAPVLRDSVPALQGSGEGSQLGALVAAFVLILVLVSISARLLRALLHATPLKADDRLLGSGFGLLRGMLLCLLAAVLIGLSPLRQHPSWEQAHARPLLHAMLTALQPLLPIQIHQLLEPAAAPRPTA